MQCPYCGCPTSRVLDSRPSGEDVRRRRTCGECNRRFTTYEQVAAPEIKVEKRSGQFEEFDRGKLQRVLARVTGGRGLGTERLRDLVRGLEAELIDNLTATIPSWRLIEKLLERLRELDPLSADRLASNFLQEDGSLRLRDNEPTSQLGLPHVQSSSEEENAASSSPVKKRNRSKKPSGSAKDSRD